MGSPSNAPVSTPPSNRMEPEKSSSVFYGNGTGRSSISALLLPFGKCVYMVESRIRFSLIFRFLTGCFSTRKKNISLLFLSGTSLFKQNFANSSNYTEYCLLSYKKTVQVNINTYIRNYKTKLKSIKWIFNGTTAAYVPTFISI